MKILILEDEPHSAKRLIRMLKDIDPMFVPEGPLGSIKETEAFFRSGKSSDLILADIRLSDGLSFEALKHAPSSVPILFPPLTMNMPCRHSSSTASITF